MREAPDGAEPDANVCASTAGAALRVLVAEDDEALRFRIVARLRREGFRVFQASTGAEISNQLFFLQIDALPDEGIDLLLLDHALPGLSGLDVLRRLRASRVDVPALLVTAFASEELRDEAKRLGVGVLAKPFSLDALARAARAAVGARPRAKGRS